MRMVFITEKLLERYSTNQTNSGFNKKHLEAFGVKFPLRKGWRKKLIGKIIDLDKVPPPPELNAPVNHNFFS